MSNETALPETLMTGSLLHFEKGVPIDDLSLRTEHRNRLARVEHVYWQWIRNPFLDAFQMFKQLVKGKASDPQSEWRMAQKDKFLFDFVVDRVAPPSRRVDEIKVRAAAEQAIKIGMETDNVQALTKGGKLLYDVAGLDKPEDNSTDMSKVAFLPTVVVTDIREVDNTKENIDDEETKRIIAKYGAYVDAKQKAIEEKVALMEARSGKAESQSEEIVELSDEQSRHQP